MSTLSTQYCRTIYKRHPWRRWGTRDLAWTVSSYGLLTLNGSAPWLAICKGWARLKGWLRPQQLANLEDWQDLPLWHPKINHVIPNSSRCNSAALRKLWDCGLKRMADILNPDGSFISWEEIRRRGAGRTCQRAFHILLLNLKRHTKLQQPEEKLNVFLKETNVQGPVTVWQFVLPARQTFEAWFPLMNKRNPKRTFRWEGSYLRPTTLSSPGLDIRLQQILVGSPSHSRIRTYFGPWWGQHPLVQYTWTDGTPLVNTSTAQLLSLQVQHAATQHIALGKWEAHVGCSVPDNIWQLTWLSFRSATENTFLWQICIKTLPPEVAFSWKTSDGPGDLVLSMFLRHCRGYLSSHMGLPHSSPLLGVGIFL